MPVAWIKTGEEEGYFQWARHALATCIAPAERMHEEQECASIVYSTFGECDFTVCLGELIAHFL
jgi:hypothetical protein